MAPAPNRLAPLVVAALAVVVLTVLVYAPVRHYEFVSFDDYDFVVGNPGIAAGLTSDSVRWAIGNAYAAAGGPLTWLSHMLDVELFGMTPGPAHLHNVVLHAVSSTVLLIVLWQMTGSTWRSAFVAALFAVHPLHVESVAWIAERKDVLSTTFWFLTMWAYVGFVRRPGAGWYGLVLIAFALGLLAKPMIATLPFVLLLIDVWPLGRVRWAWADRARWRTVVVEKLPLVTLAAAALAWTLVAQREIGAVVTFDALPLSTRLANAAVSLVTYIGKMFWPAGLAVFYPYPRGLSPWVPIACAAILVTLSVLAWRLGRRRPYLLVGWFWYLGTMIPVIGLVQVGSHGMADRFTYIPLVGLFVIVAWGGAVLIASFVPSRRLAAGVALAIVVASAVAARAQVAHWRTSEALWARALAVTRDNFRAQAGMAEVHASRGRIDDAIAHYTEAVRLAPDEGEFHVNLGMLYVRKDDVPHATAAFTRAVRLRPSDVEAINNLGALLARQGQTAEAIAQYSRALALKPDYALARRNLGLALAAQGNLAAGVDVYLEAIKQSPNEASWHYEAAVMLLQLGRVAQAIEHLKDTLRLDPSHQGARQTLASLTK